MDERRQRQAPAVSYLPRRATRRFKRRAPRGPALTLAVLGATLAGARAAAFPPYRSTDADTAGARTLEVRLGALRLQRRGSSSLRSTPLSRINYGVGRHYEVISELEYAIDQHHFAEGALGFKWASLADGRGFGVETLILLPIRSELSGAGVESQYLRTWQQERWRLHLNAGAFYDPRGAATERGLRGSLLAEFPLERLRAGIELFVRDARSGRARVQTGVGLIAPLEHFELRAGLHIGLSDAAPDLEGSVWFSWRWQHGPDAP